VTGLAVDVRRPTPEGAITATEYRDDRMQSVQTGGVRRFKLTWGDGVGAACFIAAMFNPFTR
jgi:hypothetical protein